MSALLLTGGSYTLGASPALAAACTAGTESDFNGDGIRDVAIADPQAPVSGKDAAGLVRIVLGGGKGTSEVSQAMSTMNASPETADQFGYAIATFDANADGCTDLVVGTPYEDVTVSGTTQADAGAVYIVHGSPTGIGPTATVDGFSQSGFVSTATTEAGDLFGFALAAGKNPSNNPYLAIGGPGEDVGAAVDAGGVHVMEGTAKGSVHQDVDGVAGVAENNDRFGASLAATSRFVAIGIPGEAIGTQAFAGGVGVFNHTLTTADALDQLVGLDENHPALTSGTAESGDRFGTALSILPYRALWAGSSGDVLLAVGAPNEDVGAVSDAGAVTVLEVGTRGAVSEVNLIDRMTGGADDATGVDGEPVVGDFFGQRVSLANLAPDAPFTTNIKLAVGVPNQEVGAAENAGAVHILRPGSSPGTGDKILHRGDGILPHAAEARDFTGMALTGTSESLYIGVPYSKTAGLQKGIAYSVPWTLINDGTGSVTTYRPGADGLPDVGKAFGSVIR
ncbi:VCBS repeat-containing protein [Streptomyces sp. NPDC091377]|uniref:VCBS repeat-containing protein n=1 Tax=Streptomyces sp. NPDC091377 TaxID=3365995 RepID=UPI003827191D